VQGVASPESSMFPIAPRFKASTKLAVPLCLAAINYRVICIFIATAFLLVWQVKAQENTSQVNGLVRRLQSQEADVRISAADALGQIGPEAKEAVPALIAALKDQEQNVRNFAANTLGQIGPEAMPALIAALKDQEADVRSYTAMALGGIGPDAVPPLIAALKDHNVFVRSSAADALRKIDPTAVSTELKISP
jgi:HEAT repeat protein